MKKISPCLWFENQAEEAARFYTSVFRDSEILDVTKYGEAGPGPAGSVMTVTFRIEDEVITALNGGPEFKFNEAISFQIDCRTQEEVDDYWMKLTEGGEEGPCGWLKDRYGLSWQIVPSALTELLKDRDEEKAGRVMQAMLRMKKIDIRVLEEAYTGMRTNA